ncbi:peptidase T [Enterococcus faecalis]|uniref:peptidase T n=1 Tax=Enterococcus faecalis TaxID=1351 RepID=UPI0003307772|nr:peptidase T [Enterococcus faecalis]EGO7920906.1 peptidase T [Enterococcus faecalis]EKG8980624.1 peptidase T [Enterococcus faecalis]EME3187261.1 peptidase T [Enterococcus faecalis]EOJ83150.1 peptidase T [Enterococcus faecalis EnGen0357]EPH67423.1 peptidase T [Enterococcus faecalis 02-MB-P-10]
MEKLVERFLTYVKVNTRSDANSQTTPTTVGQVVLAKMIETELHELGLADVHYNEQNGFLTARLHGNQPAAKSIGLIAHLDTADFSAENIRPQVITNYDGQDVLLNQEQGIVLSVAEFPNLKEYQGETLITTDGTTLLGADDKAGIVEILAAVEYFLTHPEVARGDVWLAFGPDEEIGRGADQFDAPNFPVAFAYTIDSGRVGHFEYETFNAAQAVITIEGTSVHPGTAYGSLVNAIKLGEQLDQSLPQKEVPEQTRGNEGFYLLNKFTGSIEKAELVYIIRDHDRENFQARKQFLEKQVQRLNALADKPRLTITFQDQYYNMKEIIEKDWTPVELAVQAMESCDIEPIITQFRGGTDGSKISFMGIPTPNLFTGGENFHGQYEFITVESMAKAVQTIIAIIRLNAN